MKIIATIPRSHSGTVTIAATDLTGDSWHDYMQHLAAAKSAEVEGELRTRNRSRAALVALSAHLEGIVDGLESRILQDRKDYATTIRGNGRSRCVRDKVLDLRRHAQEQMSERLPYLRLRSKALRDIIVHPTITKRDPDVANAKLPMLSESDLYHLTCGEVQRDGDHIGEWLSKLCRIYAFTRVHDTKEIVKSFAKSLSGRDVEPTPI